MIYSIDHAAQQLLSRGYIMRKENNELYDFALTATDTIRDHFAVFGAQVVFDTEGEIVALRHMSAEAIQNRAETLGADSAPGLFKGHALSFSRAVVLWFFRRQLDTDLEGEGDRTWLTFEQVMRGVAAYYREDLKEDEAKFSRNLQRVLGYFVNESLIETNNSTEGHVWSAHPALRGAIGADEIEIFTQQIIEALETSSEKDRQLREKDDLTIPLQPEDPDSPWAQRVTTEKLEDEE